MPTKNIGPWPLGIDMLSTETAFPKDRNGKDLAAADSFNGDFTSEGWWDSRPGLAHALTADGTHSAWNHADGRSYAAVGGNLVRLSNNGGSLTTTVLMALPADAPLDFDDFNGETLVISRDMLKVISRGDTLRDFATPDANLPLVTVANTGGLPAARYSLAISLIGPRGQEGALSALSTLDVPDGGGMRITLPPAPSGITTARIYRTEANGSVLRRVTELPLAMGTALVGSGQVGQVAATQYLRAAPFGDIVRWWGKARLLVARGRFLFFTDARSPTLYSPRHNFVQFPAAIAFVEGVEGGVYVGLKGRGVVFLQGANPKDWDLKNYTGGAPPVARSSALIDNNLLDPQLQIGSTVALWLAENGYVVGRADGTLYEPQAQRIRIPAGGVGRTTVFDRRVLTIITN